ncbi:MAG: adenylate/guanylate cyclase domain-containing protein [Methylovulum sp.]|nr:adenylate/guanylate cyclase domain-containing protein [Methylovulum sp.]
MRFSTQWLKIYRILSCIAISSIFMMHATGWLKMPVLQRIENISYDLRLRATVANTLDPRIVIVTLDEDSLAQEGRWPWSRDKMAYLVDMLFDYYHIKLLGFDVLFAEPDNSSGVTLLDKLAAGALQQDTGFLSALATLRPQLAYDAVFAKSLANRPVVMGYFTSHIKEKTPQVGKLPPPLASVANWPFSTSLFNVQSYTANLGPLQTAAQSGGFFNNPAIDPDGVYRKLPLVVNYHNQVYEALSLALFRTLLGQPPVQFIIGENYGLNQADNRLEGLRIEGFTVPVDENGAILVPFRGRQGSFNYIPATDVLNGITDPAKLKDKIVIFGTTAAGLLDSRATPVQSVYPGVEIHANVLSALLDQTLKSRPNYILAVEVVELLLICLLGVLVFPRLSAVSSALVFGLLFSAILIGNLYCWITWNIDTLLASPLILLTLLYGIQIFFSFFLESRRKRQLSALFGQYIPPELVAQMSQSDETFSLTGESREMTVLFSDVRGFTHISETMDPQRLCELINAILTPVTQVIHEAQGTIDKYIGDAVMAFWGAPMHNPNHAAYAVRSALAIVEMMTLLQQEFKTQGWPVIEMGIGINTGTMSVGNMGSQFRMAYTVMGDAVNLGARLEGLTKQYGVKIIVSAATRQAAPEFIYRELDTVRVKGKHQPITIYEPLGDNTKISAEQAHLLSLLNQGLQHYRQQQWPDALAIFTQLAAAQPDDRLYALYLDRIRFYQLSPPAGEWDGIFTYTSK